MWNRWLDRVLRRFVRHGTLNVTFPEGHARSYGSGAPEVNLRLNDTGLPRRLILDPQLALGEAWMDGTLEIDGDDLHGVLELVNRNMAVGAPGRLARLRDVLRRALRRLQQFNPASRARRNVAHHYDLSGERSQQGFRHGRMCVYQLQLARRPDAVPITRDYLLAPTAALPDGRREAAE